MAPCADVRHGRPLDSNRHSGRGPVDYAALGLSAPTGSSTPTRDGERWGGYGGLDEFFEWFREPVATPDHAARPHGVAAAADSRPPGPPDHPAGADTRS